MDRFQVPVPEEWTDYRNLSLIEHPHGGLIAFFQCRYKKFPQEYSNIIMGYYFDDRSSRWNRIGDYLPYSSSNELFNQVTYLNLMGNLHMIFFFENQLKQQFSYDYGKTWNPSTIILEDMINWELKNRPLFVQMGRVILPVFDIASGRSFAYISDNTGKTWFPSVFIELSEELLEDSDPDELSPCVMRSPTFIQAGERKILCFMQLTDHPYLAQAISNDIGETWSSAEEIKIPSGSGGIDAIRLRDNNGDYTPVVVLAYCEKKSREKYALKLAISIDVAETWNEIVELEISSSLCSDVTLLQSNDNRLHVLFSSTQQIQHFVLHNYEFPQIEI